MIELFPTITAHCFWGTCNHTVTGFTPETVHDEMELHYESVHRAQLDGMFAPAHIRSTILAAAREVQP